VQQVITIGTDGTISGLQVKPGKGLDLQALGRAIGVPAKTERVSEIAWDEMEQAWFVEPIRGAFAGKWITFKMFKTATSSEYNSDARLRLHDLAPAGYRIQEDGTGDGLLLFISYEDAVRVEVAFIDAMRAKGQF
jgi:hypothetical protein